MSRGVGSKIAVIVPQVVVHNMDPHTGIPFMPHIAAYLVSVLRKESFAVQVLDAFGSNPHNREVVKQFMLLGASPDWISRQIKPDVKVCYIYCRTVAEYVAVERISSAIRAIRPDVKICLFENAQAVTAFSLKHVAMDLLTNCCDLMILGDPEKVVTHLSTKLLEEKSFEEIPSLAYLRNGQVHFTAKDPADLDLDSLPFPAWDKIPVKGYWSAVFTHGPRQTPSFLPLLTSRGCPFQCKFCISPQISNRWQWRSAKNVVDEMEYFLQSMRVREFHISDLNPTVNEKRVREICEEIISRNLQIIWKLAQGTKIETIGEETIGLMAKAGCNYISFSPETGSGKLLKAMKKPFDHDHGLKMVKKMNEVGIRSQACFIAGLPGEDESARLETVLYLKKLVKNGVDEIAVFAFAPIPGSDLSKSIKGYSHYSECTFSPSWRKDRKIVAAFRRRLYLTFFLHKLKHPRKVLREVRGFLNRRFETKMEMSIYKLLKLYILRFCPWILPKPTFYK